MKAVNSYQGMRRCPAGIDTNDRTPGIIRPQNTEARPCRSNQACALTTSSSPTRGIRASVRRTQPSLQSIPTR